MGAHLKNTIALAVGGEVFLSQHIGDLDTEPARRAFRRVVADFEQLLKPGRQPWPWIRIRIISPRNMPGK